MSLTEYSAVDGAALAERPAHEPAAPATPEYFGRLDLDALRPSPTNPRKTFDPTKLAELAESIKASGVHQPILVRPDLKHPSGSGYEIVSGERRYRASQLAGVADIPAMIRPLTDHQVLEIQLVENLQRDDLTPLEEAEGYARLAAETGIAKEDIGARIGRSRGYVYGRLKLLDLGEDGRMALEAGDIDASTALLIARIPDTTLQAKALKEATATRYGGEPQHSYRSFREWVQGHLMLKLSAARFKITDASLVPAAGSCRECPKRTGANPDLFSDVKGADVCTDPGCFHGKEAAHDARQVEQAREQGRDLIVGKEAEKIWPHKFSSDLQGYVRLDKPDLRLSSGKTLAKVLGKDAPTPVVLQSPHDGSLVEVLPRDTVTKLLKAKGLLSDRQARAKRSISKEEAESQERAAFELAWRRRAIERLDAAMRAGGVEPRGPTSDLARCVARMFMGGLRQDEGQHVAKLLNIGKVGWSEALDELLQQASPEDLTRIMLVLLMEHDTLRVTSWEYNDQGGTDGVTPTKRIDAVGLAMGIDVDAIRMEVADEIDASKRETDQAKGGTKQGKSETKVAAGGTPTAQGDAPGPWQPANRDALPVGAKVRFKTDLRGPGGKMRKVAGRDGQVIGHMGDRALMVRYGPATHEVASADWTELLLVEGVPAAGPQDLAKPKLKRKATKAEASAAIAAGLQQLEDGTPEAALAGAVGADA